MSKRERGNGYVTQHMYLVSKPGDVPPPETPTGMWITDSTGDAIKWRAHRKTGEWVKYQRPAPWYVVTTFRGKTRMESARDVTRGIAGTKQDAIRLLRQRREEMGLDKRGIQTFTGPDREKTTFEDLKRIAEDHIKVKPRKSERSWRAAWKALAGFFAGKRALAITHATLNEYIAQRLAMRKTRGTVRVELATLRQAFKLAAIDGKAIPPTFPSPDPSEPRKGFFEVDQYDALLAQLSDAAIQPLVQFLRETGWRLSEGRTLRWTQVDFTTKIIRLDPGTTKNDEGRTFPFGALPTLDTLLQRQRAQTSADEAATRRLIPHVFHDRGRPILEPRFYRHWWAATKAAGIYREWPHAETGKRCRGPIPHDFRRTAVRDLVRAAVGDKVAMEITGHKTRSVFERYNIVSERDKVQGIEKLAALRDTQTHTRRTVVSMQAAQRRRSR